MAKPVSPNVSHNVVRAKDGAGRLPTYLLRRRAVFFFQIRPRPPKDLASGARMLPIRIRIGAVSPRIAQRIALQLADVAMELFERLGAEMEQAPKATQGELDFPAAAEAEAAEDLARSERYMAELKTMLGKAVAALNGPPPPFLPKTPTALRDLANWQEAVLIEKEVRLGADGHPLIVSRADLLRADLRRRMQAEADAAALAPEATAIERHPEPVRAEGGGATADANPTAPQPDVSPVAAKAPSKARGNARALAAGARPKSTAPRFSEAVEEYLEIRRGVGADKGTISTARMRADVFIAVMKDKPLDRYLPIDLQTYVNRLQFLPLEYGKEGKDTAEIRKLGPLEAIERNERERCWKPLTRKTMEDGYVQIVKATVNSAVRYHPMPHPFAGARIIWPRNARPSVKREAPDDERLNQLFQNGVASGFIDDALLLPLAYTTSRRIGLLAYLRGADFQTKHGVTIVRTDGIAFDSTANVWYRAPFKTEESLNYFVLHEMWEPFAEWARAQGDSFIFRHLHTCVDPADAASSRCNRQMKKAGAIGCNIEVPHALRHGAKDTMIDGDIDGETRRKQMGQSAEAADAHAGYGTKRELSREQCQRLARLPLSKGVDWSIFKGLDFEAMAAKPRVGGRPKGKKNPA